MMTQNNGNQQGMLRRNFIAQQQTMPQPLVSPSPPFPNVNLPITPLPPSIAPTPPASVTPSTKKKKLWRIVAGLLVVGLVGAIYFIWHTSPTSTTSTATASVSQQNFSSGGTSAPTTDGIKVYVVGAVKNPGLYTLATGARVYDLLQAAGGPLPKANLVAINMAAKLSDGQEVYVTLIGEAPPTYVGGVSGPGASGTAGTGNTSGGKTSGSNTSGQLVNINTASVDELSQGLHISKKSAQAIIDYRTQHGDYSSVDQLAQVVSSSIYNKIKALCTV